MTEAGERLSLSLGDYLSRSFLLSRSERRKLCWRSTSAGPKNYFKLEKQTASCYLPFHARFSSAWESSKMETSQRERCKKQNKLDDNSKTNIKLVSLSERRQAMTVSRKFPSTALGPVCQVRRSGTKPDVRKIWIITLPLSLHARKRIEIFQIYQTFYLHKSSFMRCARHSQHLRMCMRYWCLKRGGEGQTHECQWVMLTRRAVERYQWINSGKVESFGQA